MVAVMMVMEMTVMMVTVVVMMEVMVMVVVMAKTCARHILDRCGLIQSLQP